MLRSTTQRTRPKWSLGSMPRQAMRTLIPRPGPAGRVEVPGVPDGIEVVAVVPVLYDPLDPRRAPIATLGWPVMDTLLPLLLRGGSMPATEVL
jgi:hypothetical protein